MKFLGFFCSGADTKLLLSDQDPTWPIITDPDPAWWVISDPDPTLLDVSDPDPDPDPER